MHALLRVAADGGLCTEMVWQAINEGGQSLPSEALNDSSTSKCNSYSRKNRYNRRSDDASPRLFGLYFCTQRRAAHSRSSSSCYLAIDVQGTNARKEWKKIQ